LASNCNKTCGGNTGEICGGFWANSIYSTKSDCSSNISKYFLINNLKKSDRDLSQLNFFNTDICLSTSTVNSSSKSASIVFLINQCMQQVPALSKTVLIPSLGVLKRLQASY